jgi:hypothetical protein
VVNELEIAGGWWVAHVAATWALVGLIWTVQTSVYPQFRWWAPDHFVRRHADYMRRIGWVVGPLMGIEGVTAVVWVWRSPEAVWAWVGLSLVGVIWVSTAGLQVPLHQRLGRGLELELVNSLVRGNWVRTLAWTARGILVAWVSVA